MALFKSLAKDYSKYYMSIRIEIETNSFFNPSLILLNTYNSNSNPKLYLISRFTWHIVTCFPTLLWNNQATARGSLRKVDVVITEEVCP